MNRILTFVLLMTVCPLLAQSKKQKNAAASVTPAPAEIRVPMAPASWDFKPGSAEFIEHKGVKAVKMNEKSGYMLVKDLQFKDGTIAFDVELNQQGPFPSVYFHWQSEKETEHVYLRTGTMRKSNAFDAVQYASIIKGANIWDLQHEFQSSANIKINEWNHVKVVVSGKQLRVYVNDAKEPNLEIPCMEGNTADGRLGIGTSFPGQAIFANLVVKPNETEGLPAVAAPDLTKHDTRYIRDWQISQPDSLPNGRELSGSMLPKPELAFEPISTERRGIVNISRKYGMSEKRRYVWLKARIHSEFAQKQTLKMGFSDEIWVFLNGMPVYVDKDIYYMNMRKSPNGRISLDNCSFQIPLKTGDNELLIGVANDFYGWAIMARFENLEGITVLK